MRRKWTPYVLLLPQIILGIIFLLGLGIGITQSFGVIPSLGLTKPTLHYYKEIVVKSEMWHSVCYSIYIAIVSAVGSTVIGVLFCAFLVSRKQAKGKLLSMVQLPVIVPHIVVAVLIINILSQNGILARVAFHLGMITEQQQFPMLIYDRHGIGIILAYLWKETPFIIYFVVALMANINGKLGEAAINLGANKFKTFFKITLPLCMPTILSGFLIIFSFTLGAYELPLLLGATTPKALPILSYIQYTHPDMKNRPYAMALNGIIIVISLLSAIIYFIMLKKQRKQRQI
jgi:putative spermidine/putrescine transport system permease protein